MNLERPLDPTEIRVLGCLLEKQQTTPDVYPLTMNALRSAANQSTNRDPVTSFDEATLEASLGRLQEIGLVWKVIGGRAVRWDHNLDVRWNLTPATKAIVTLLFLRGPQTPGELRGRSERMHRFDSVSEVEATLEELVLGDEPMVRELPRRPGQKESRWIHLAGDEPPPRDDDAFVATSERVSLTSRVEQLEDDVASLRDELHRLKSLLGEID